MAMKIRKATTKDIPQLVRLYKGVKEIADFAGQKYDKNYFKYFIKGKHNIVLVAEDKGNIIGSLNAEFEDDTKFTFFINLVVSTKHRSKGIGRKLMSALAKASKKRRHTRIFGLVYKWNKGMQRLNERMGYKPSGNMILYTKKL